jgi:hypothetical protein
MEEDSMDRSQIDEYRAFLKDDIRMMIDFRQTDQSRGKNPPPIEKPYDPQKKGYIRVSQKQSFNNISASNAFIHS